MNHIWIGASSLAVKLLNKWRKVHKDYSPFIILDNDPSKVGKLINGVAIDSVSNIQKYLIQEHEIIITTSFVDEVKKQLSELNITSKIIDYKAKDLEVSSNILKKNEHLLNSSKSKRCFVIGNAPSLGELDLDKIINDDKIMVNNFYKNPSLINLNPTYWMLADPLFWKKDQLFLDPILDILNGKLSNTKLFISDEALGTVKRDIIDEENIYYYHMDNCNSDISSVSEIDFTNIVPLFAQNVISTSLMLALFLKYEEIVLIGCDHTWWNYSKEEIENGVIPPHYYTKNDLDKKTSKNIFKDYGYEGIRKTIERQKQEYYQLKLIAQSKDIKILNATPGGYLEIFDRIIFEDLFREGE
ncbi:hypothetical protein [Psychrobacillus sp. L3]|uniref:hypothetical protein n=1 Tax=Psychrobacillus sp. L3 TaxID=3236891 RepID=UPI0036F34955